jgi:hypothetical protein
MSYYINNQGQYIGAFVGVEPPEGSMEVPSAPADARQVWFADEWGVIPESVPAVVSRAQGIRALYDAGALDSIEAAVAAAPRPTQLAWASVSEFHRDSPMIAALGGGLDLDTVFIYAKTIKL